ncbi:HYR domain-containing protein [Cystobacter fuscus]
MQYPEQCDTGLQNGVPGTPCSAVCRTQWCGDGVVDPGEECDTGAANGSGSCSASCRALARPPVARCKDLLLPTTTTCGATGSVDDGSSDPDGDLVGCTQTPSATFALGTTAVTLTCTDATGLSASCTARVTVTDTTPPRIDCSPEFAVECTGRLTPAQVPAPSCPMCASTATSGPRRRPPSRWAARTRWATSLRQLRQHVRVLHPGAGARHGGAHGDAGGRGGADDRVRHALCGGGGSGHGSL